jgi:TRAP-type C4-dicarboxylate transport system substrate-binding protein
MQIKTILKSIGAAVIAAGILPGTAMAKPEFKLTFSTYWPTTYGYLYDPIVSFAKKVEERSNGRIEVELFHSAQLFGGKEEMSALERGDIDLASPLDTYNTGLVPELGISSMPFLWPSPTAVQKSLDAGLFDLGISQAMAKRNVKVLNVAVGGPYQFYGKGFKVTKPADLAGKKIAVSGTAASKAMELIGAAPTSMSSSDLYIALQRGTIDATARPLITGIGRKLYEVLDNVTVVNMSYFTTFLSINMNTWNKLPPDLQKIVQDAANERSAEQLQILNQYLIDAKSLFEKNGVDYYVAPESELAVFQNVVSPVYGWWKTQVPTAEKYIDFAQKNQ